MIVGGKTTLRDTSSSADLGVGRVGSVLVGGSAESGVESVLEDGSAESGVGLVLVDGSAESGVGSVLVDKSAESGVGLVLVDGSAESGVGGVGLFLVGASNASTQMIVPLGFGSADKKKKNL